MSTPYTRSGTLRGLVLATAVTGTLLLLASFAGAIWSGGSPAAMLTNIASGIIGDAAWRDPLIGPVLGLLVHFIVIGALADLYIVASIRISALNRHWRVSGALFGLVAWMVRSTLAAPRDWPPAVFGLTAREAVAQILLHVLLLGLPVALLTRWAARWKG